MQICYKRMSYHYNAGAEKVLCEIHIPPTKLYASLNNSKQDAVKAAYDPNVERFLRSYIGKSNGETDSERKTLLQNMRVADMTMEELWELLNAYKMILHSVRDANKLFVKGMYHVTTLYASIAWGFCK